MEQDKMIYCENCNAPIPEESAKCPYCGALNLPGGEKKYMENLFELKEDVEELKSTPIEAYKDEVKKTGRIIRNTLFGVIIAALLIGALVIWVRYPIEKKEPIEDVKARLEWEKENYPKLDELYEAKDYDAILEFEASAIEDGTRSISTWEHYDFINEYRRYISFKEDAAAIESGDYDEDNVYWCLMDAVFFRQDKSYAGFNDEETEYIEQYRSETNEFLIDTLGMEQEEIDKLYADCCAEDEFGTYVDYKKTQKAIKVYIKKGDLLR